MRTAWSTTSSSRAASSTRPQSSCDSSLPSAIASVASGWQRGQHAGGVEPLAVLQLGEDVVGADHGVLQVGAALPFEAQRLVDVERDDLAARELHHEVAHGRDRRSSPPSAAPRPAVSSVLRRATSSAALSVSRSIRSSALTPRPLRPDTSTNGLPLSSVDCVAELARGAVRQRDHLVRVVDRAPRLLLRSPAPRAPASAASADTPAACR